MDTDATSAHELAPAPRAAGGSASPGTRATRRSHGGGGQSFSTAPQPLDGRVPRTSLDPLLDSSSVGSDAEAALGADGQRTPPPPRVRSPAAGRGSWRPTAGAPTGAASVLLYPLFFVFGIAMLGPWNTWITAAPYFQTRLAGSPFATSFQSYIAIAFMATNLTSLLAMLRFQHKIDTSARVVGGFVLSAAVFLLAAWMPQWTSLDASAYFGISLVLIAASSVSSALLGGLIGYASAFPPVFVAAISSGQGMAGVVPSVSQLLLLGMSPTGEGTGGPQRATPRFSAIMQAYFSISVVISVVSLGGFVYLLRGGAGRGASRHDADERRGGDAAPDRARGFSSRSRLRSVEDSEEAAAPILSLPSDDDEDDGAPSATRLDVDLAGDDEAAADARGTVTLGQILPAVRPCAAAMVLNFAITLGVFPTLTSFVQSTGQLSGVIAPGLFVPVHFLVFNVADLAGKSLPLIPRLASFAPATLLRATAWRLVFFPLLALCNITVADRSGAALPRVLPLVFGDAAYLAILALLGLTGGWLGTLLFIAGPAAAGHGRGAARAAAVRLGGDVMVVALAIGLLAGSAASFGLRGLVCGCNPFVS